MARYTCGEIITITGLISYMKLDGGLNPSEKYEFVSWDYDNPNICKVIIHSMVPNHQPDMKVLLDQPLWRFSFCHGTPLDHPVVIP